ncbi:extracellular triacylglycerol lipase precursor [Hymenopellis radicata]|nr:extracellular triacylglycerol lipase precursor [Hymenopellis radicata]
MATLLYLAALAGVALCAPQVQVGNTTLIGRDVTLLQQDFFGGIPYAEPPLGELRLQAPVTKFFLDDDVFNASSFGPGCLQPQASFPISEDCLTINIFRPSGISENASLPVLFWAYGGGFLVGASSTANGSAIVAHSVQRGTPVIYVNFNYRLGPLGYPQGNEADSRGELNLALKDYLAALEWVQMNIHAFGGDNSKVTIFGESAGAIMTAVLLLNPSISQLARAAILESGSAASSVTFDAAPRQDSWEGFVDGIPSCKELATTNVTFDCIRLANTSEVFEGLLHSIAVADELISFTPTLDGPDGLFPDYPSRLFSQGKFARIPFIAGTNLDEGTTFVRKTINLTEAEEKAYFAANFSPPGLPDDVVDRLFELYPDDPALGSPTIRGMRLSAYQRPSNGWRLSVTGDISFQSQRRLLSQTAANAGVKTYGYLFEQHLLSIAPYLGVAHANDVYFVYGAVPSMNETASSNALSLAMIDYWVSFATSLDPNDGLGVARPLWPQYTSDNQVLMQLNGDNLTSIPDDYRQEQISFINDNAVLFHH